MSLEGPNDSSLQTLAFQTSWVVSFKNPNDTMFQTKVAAVVWFLTEFKRIMVVSFERFKRYLVSFERFKQYLVVSFGFSLGLFSDPTTGVVSFA